MAVSFTNIPANIKVPLFYAEISNELAGSQDTDTPAMLIGPAVDPDPAVLNTPVLISSVSMAYEVFGAGSILADMVNTYRANDTYGELWAIAVADDAGSAAATGTLTITGQATAGGTLPVYIAGDLYRIGVARGATAASVASVLADQINADPFGLLSAEASAVDLSTPGVPGEIKLTAKQAGEIGNEIDVTVAWRKLAAGEQVPAGLTVTVTPMADGGGIPDLKPGLDAMADDVYDYCAIPYSDTASLDAVEFAMNDTTGRWAWDRQVYGHFFGAKMGTVNDLVTFGRTRNDQHFSLLGFAKSPTPPWRRAAALAAQAATSVRAGPGEAARPLQTLPLLGVLPPNREDAFNISQRQSLLTSGIACETTISGGTVVINRCVTTYQRNAWGQADQSYLDVTTMFTLMAFVRTIRSAILQKFPRSKLADDGTAFGPGQAVVTPNIIRAEIVACYLEMVDNGLVENVASFKDLLIVERDTNDPNRVNVLASPDLVNQLRVLGMLVAFRLQTSATALATAA